MNNPDQPRWKCYWGGKNRHLETCSLITFSGSTPMEEEDCTCGLYSFEKFVSKYKPATASDDTIPMPEDYKMVRINVTNQEQKNEKPEITQNKKEMLPSERTRSEIPNHCEQPTISFSERLHAINGIPVGELVYKLHPLAYEMLDEIKAQQSEIESVNVWLKFWKDQALSLQERVENLQEKLDVAHCLLGKKLEERLKDE